MEPDDLEEMYDFIYVRFVLTHLTDPAGALANLSSKLVPGGALVVEDIDFTGHFCHPDSPAFRRYVEWYSRRCSCAAPTRTSVRGYPACSPMPGSTRSR